LKAITYFEDEVKDIIVSTGFAVVRPQNKFIPKFLYYVVRSENFIGRVCALSVGVSYPAINSTELSDVVIWYPHNKEEQKRIVKFLDDMVMKTKTVIKRLQAEIECLKEYRTALISEVVTGKIDVGEG
jgi:type I restriction enzyme S subunit